MPKDSDTLTLSGKGFLIVSGLLGVFYIAIGILWLIYPDEAATALGASLLEGTGLATQIGDNVAFFICSGLFMLAGVLTRSGELLFAGGLLIGMVAPVRFFAWWAHGAALTVEPIAVEILTFGLLFLASRAVRPEK